MAKLGLSFHIRIDSTIDLTSMSDLDDFHDQGVASHGIDQAVIAGTNAPCVIGARQFNGAVREWIGCESYG